MWLLPTCAAIKQCNVCSSTSCLYRGAKLFESALRELKTDDVTINAPGCLRQCGRGVVFKAFGDGLDPP